MPFQDEGSLNQLLPGSYEILSVPTVTTETTVGGFTASGAPLVSDQPRTIQQAAVDASSAVTVIPTATAPAIANLPQNAKKGAFYQFASQPAILYVMCPDNLWRGLLLVPVV